MAAASGSALVVSLTVWWVMAAFLMCDGAMIRTARLFTDRPGGINVGTPVATVSPLPLSLHHLLLQHS
jgi:hypothetical protein